MTEISTLVNRLKKIGINIELLGNYPWIYLDKVNGKTVIERYQADHGFTIAFYPVRVGQPLHFTDLSEIFKILRKYGKENQTTNSKNRFH